MLIPETLREEWGDYVWWDRAAKAPKPLTRDEVGANSTVGDPLLEGAVEVTLADGKKVRCRPVFDLVQEYAAHFDPKTVEELTWAPAAAVESLARDFAQDPGTTLFAIGMGPNQFFNNDNKDRDIFLLAALTGNVGKIGGNVGSYAGNYRVALFNGVAAVHQREPVRHRARSGQAGPAQAVLEGRVGPLLQPRGPSAAGRATSCSPARPTCPTPTKSLWFANANSILGNVKWHYNTVVNVLPRIEMIAVQRVVVVHLLRVGRRGLRRRFLGGAEAPRHDRLGHQPVPAGLPAHAAARGSSTPSATSRCWPWSARKLAELTGDQRFNDYWKFVREGRTDVYLQRILDHSTNTKGYQFADLEAKAKRGHPGPDESRTHPEGGRLRAGDRFAALVHQERAAGVLPRGGRVHRGRREPAGPPRAGRFDLLRAERHRGPQARGDPARRARKPTAWRRTTCRARRAAGATSSRPGPRRKDSPHPLAKDGYRFIFHTPKYRHGAHTTADRHRHGGGPVRSVRRPLPPRQAHARSWPRATWTSTPPTPRSWASRTATTSGSTPIPDDRPFRGWQKNKRGLRVRAAALPRPLLSRARRAA